MRLLNPNNSCIWHNFEIVINSRIYRETISSIVCIVLIGSLFLTCTVQISKWETMMLVPIIVIDMSHTIATKWWRPWISLPPSPTFSAVPATKACINRIMTMNSSTVNIVFVGWATKIPSSLIKLVGNVLKIPPINPNMAYDMERAKARPAEIPYITPMKLLIRNPGL